SQRSRSRFAEGSAFSWITRLADVWRTNTVHSPCSTFTSAATFAVMSCSPRPFVSTANCLIIRPCFERRHGRKFFPFQKLQKRPAARGNIGNSFFQTKLRNRRERVAAAGDRIRARLGDGARDRVRALGERVDLEHADRAIP